MSYSAFFTAGLSLASRPRSDSIDEPPSQQFTSVPPQIHVQPNSSLKPRLRRRRSSLTIATSPMSAVKSPLRSANDAARSSMRTPSQTSISLMDAFQGTPDASTSMRPKMTRRKTVSGVQDLLSTRAAPTLPAPTAPLPPLPSLLSPTSLSHHRSTSISSTIDETLSSSPIAVDPVLPSLRSNPARKSSSALPPPFAGSRGPFTSSSYGNLDKQGMALLSERSTAPDQWMKGN